MSSCSGRRHIGHCTSASGAFVIVVVRLKAEKFRPVLARSHFSIVSSSRCHWLSINLLSERNNNNVSLWLWVRDCHGDDQVFDAGSCFLFYCFCNKRIIRITTPLWCDIVDANDVLNVLIYNWVFCSLITTRKYCFLVMPIPPTHFTISGSITAQMNEEFWTMVASCPFRKDSSHGSTNARDTIPSLKFFFKLPKNRLEILPIKWHGLGMSWNLNFI